MTAKSKKPRPRSLADQVYEYLRSAILSGDIAQGEKLVELDIAAEMGTSQGPVREALQRLGMEGLVVRHARSASYVIKLDPDEMQELFAVRAMIEGLAIRQTVQNMDEGKMSLLKGLLEQIMAAADDNDMPRLVEHDLEFHRYIMEWSGRGALIRAWTLLYSQIQLYVIQTREEFFPDIQKIASEHQIVIETIQAGDPERAQKVIHDHVMYIWSVVDDED